MKIFFYIFLSFVGFVSCDDLAEDSEHLATIAATSGTTIQNFEEQIDSPLEDSGSTPASGECGEEVPVDENLQKKVSYLERLRQQRNEFLKQSKFFNESISEVDFKQKYEDISLRDILLSFMADLKKNQTAIIGTANTNNTNSKKSYCTTLPFNETVLGDVQVLNASSLQKLLITTPNVTNRSTPARCVLVYFFSHYCPFSAQGSAYVNALARSLHNIPIYGLDSIEDHSVNTRYGVMGTPSLLLFHNGNVVGRYNASEYSTFFLESFVHHFTDQVIHSINVTSHDFKASLPSQVTHSVPYALYCAWLFLISCSCCSFLNSDLFAKLKEAVLNNWREAEAQHAHIE